MEVQIHYDINDGEEIYFETSWHRRLYLKDIMKQAINEYFTSKQCQETNKENKYKQCIDEVIEQIEYIEATAERIDDDNYIPLACKIAESSRNILQIIKQVKGNEQI